MGRRRGHVDGPHAVLLLDKPAGISSAAVVARVRRVLGGVKGGHTGTLDPFATGLLPVCLGEATKLATWLTDADKCYEGTIRLGVCTDTLDRTGEVTATAPVPAIDDATLAALEAEFTGDLMQVPPRFSAIKRGGRPMYELARRGEAPELEARPAHVARLGLRREGPDLLAVSIDCSKGFYVRSLARDLGERLGCGAVLESLRRTRVGDLDLGRAVPLAALEEEGGEEVALAAQIPLVEAAAHLPRREVSGLDAADLRLGRQAPLARLGVADDGTVVRVACGGDLVAIAARRGGLWNVERVFAPQRIGSGACPVETPVLPPRVSRLEEEERNEANRRD